MIWVSEELRKDNEAIQIYNQKRRVGNAALRFWYKPPCKPLRRCKLKRGITPVNAYTQDMTLASVLNGTSDATAAKGQKRLYTR